MSKFPGWRTMTGTQRRNAKMHALFDRAREQGHLPDWSGSQCPIDPDNFWIDDITGERVNAATGERSTALHSA